MVSLRVTAFLVLAIAFQALCQDCGDGNVECPQPGIDTSLNFCIDVFHAIENYFQEQDRDCIILLGEFRNATRGELLCNGTVRKLRTVSRRTDVDATINTVFCDGVVKGFSATLNGAGLRWVCGRHMRNRIESVTLEEEINIPITEDDVLQG